MAVMSCGRGVLLLGAFLCYVPLSMTQSSDVGELFAPSGHRSFGDAMLAISRFLAEVKPESESAQHFCAIGYRGAGGALAWVHWTEGRRLILWFGRGSDGGPDDSLVRSNRNLDLDRDVVASEADIAGSTYLVTTTWVEKTLADCAARGDRYLVSPP